VNTALEIFGLILAIGFPVGLLVSTYLDWRQPRYVPPTEAEERDDAERMLHWLNRDE